MSNFFWESQQGFFFPYFKEKKEDLPTRRSFVQPQDLSTLMQSRRVFLCFSETLSTLIPSEYWICYLRRHSPLALKKKKRKQYIVRKNTHFLCVSPDKRGCLSEIKPERRLRRKDRTLQFITGVKGSFSLL